VRIVSLLTTATSVPTALLSATPSGITFRAALANLSEHTNADSGSMGSDAKSDTGAGVANGLASQHEKEQTSSSMGDASVRTTSIVSPTVSTKTSSVIKSNGQSNDSHRAESDSGAATSAYSSSTAEDIANGKHGHTMHTKTDIRITSAAQASIAIQVPGIQADIPIQAVQASSTGSEANALTTAPIPTTYQPTTFAADQLDEEIDVNHFAESTTSAASQKFDFSEPDGGRSAQSQLPLFQSVVGPTEQSASKADSAKQTATSLQPLNSATPANESVTPEVQASSPAISSWMPQVEAGIAAQIGGENFTVPMEMPKAVTSPSNGEWTQLVGKASGKKITEGVAAKNSELGSTTEAAKNTPTNSLGTVSDGTSHGNQNNGQSVQHSQMGTAQAADVAVKVNDGGTNQAQVSAMHLLSHEAVTTLRSADGAVDGSTHGLPANNPTSNESEGGDAAATSGINAAKLIHAMGQTEMSVGMHSSEFGNISIRTSVSQQQMLAQISLDHGGLSQALSSHISSMQSKLENDYGLHTLIEVNSQGALSSGDSGNYAQREQQEFVRSGRNADPVVAAEPEPGLGQGTLVSVSDGVRLDIRA